MRVGFETLGCRSNYADTIDLQAALSERGISTCESAEGVEVFVLNTCTVTNDADKEAYRAIKRARRRSPGAKIVVTGCLAEVGAAELLQTGLVDAVIGPGRRNEVLGAILNEPISPVEVGSPKPLVVLPERRVMKSLPERRSISLHETISAQIPGPGARLGETPVRARYHLRVQEGCENSCTFCIIPLTRGRLSSRDTKDILSDIRHLASVGYREVVLTGTHLGGFGEDIGTSLRDLLVALKDESEIRRIRLSSIDPNDVDEDLILLLASDGVFCNHLHICVQAFCEHTLKRMNRRYSLARALEILNQAKASIPGLCLGSDLIAGFPGETREQMEGAQAIFARSGVDYLHVFPYSERRETPATRLDGEVEVSERKRRAARWRALSDRAWMQFLQGLSGTPLEILVETYDDKFLYGTGRNFSALKVSWEAIDASQDSVIGKTFSVVGLSVDSCDERLICE